MRLLELQNESDSLQACAAAGRAVADSNLRGWAALVPLEPVALSEGLRQSGLPVLEGARGALALGSIAQIWAMLPNASAPRAPSRTGSPDWRSPSLSATGSSGTSAAHPRRFESATARPAAAHA